MKADKGKKISAYQERLRKLNNSSNKSVTPSKSVGIQVEPKSAISKISQHEEGMLTLYYVIVSYRYFKE
jgi:hypothetical protein